MLKKLFAVFLNKKTFFRGSAILAFTSLLSNLLGLLRDRLLAHGFGASSALDAYNAAFVVPNLLLNIFVAGALTAAFVPIFSGLIEKKETTEANDFANSALNSSILIILLTGLLAFIFAPQISHLIVPGFTPESKNLFVGLMRLLMLSPLIFAVSNTLGNILVSNEKFFWYGLSSAIYNVGIIGGVFFLSHRFGVYGVVIGAIAGALLHLVFRLIGIGRHYFRYRSKIKIDGHFKKYIKLMLPKMAGQPIEQLTFLGFTVIASTISTGAIVVLNFANNFQTVPVSIIGITFALIAFPVLSKIATRNNKNEFISETLFNIKAIIVTTIPVAVLMYFFRRPIISILLGGGAFDRQSIELTAAILGIFTLSIVTESINHLLARAFYALKNSAIPTLIAFGGLAITLAGGYGFTLTMGVKGLAFGFFLGSIFKIIFHAIFLKNLVKKSFIQTSDQLTNFLNSSTI